MRPLSVCVCKETEREREGTIDLCVRGILYKSVLARPAAAAANETRLTSATLRFDVLLACSGHVRDSARRSRSLARGGDGSGPDTCCFNLLQ